jgi:hypothetical protein
MALPPSERRDFRVFLFVLGSFLLFGLCFLSELWRVDKFFFTWLLFDRRLELDRITLRAWVGLGYEAGVFALVFIASLMLVAQFVLPVQTREERWGVIDRLWLYIQRWHGPAISIKNGLPVASPAEKDNQRHGPGVALVDSVSALALERDTPPTPDIDFKDRRGGLGGLLYWLEHDLRDYGLGLFALPLSNWRWFSVMFRRRWRQYQLTLRLARPRQPRQPKTSARVEGAGIVFTEANESVRATLDLRRQVRSRSNIKGLTRDGLEIQTTLNVTFTLDDQRSGSTAADRASFQRNEPPFRLNKRNAFHAVYGSPTSKNEDDEVRKWSDLPAFVASDIFRDLISTYTLDSLFRPNQDGDLPLDILRTQFDRRVKDEPILRERGIKVLAAGFSKLIPPDPVTEQRMRSWQAEWERQRVETLAGGELEAARIIQRERVKAQYDMVCQMKEILEDQRNPRILVALRLFQTLEAASSQPGVRPLLPHETVEALKNWLDRLLICFGRGPATK